MEVVDVISHYIDKNQNLITVEFKSLGDDDDQVREDFIEYSFLEEFGFDNQKDFEIFESYLEDVDDDWESDDFDYIDENVLITFLNEYYVVYPNKLPKPQYK